ncbi:MAG: class I SAM-dependent methyltransferase [Alphaproteobacteria bacterium]|nr:class I SAM-dependent methyltransferase [Alphaproteobacteria bacterium]
MKIPLFFPSPLTDSTQYYNVNSQNYFDTTVQFNMAVLYDLFLPYLPEGAKVLDAGCGSGRDSKYFIERGYTVSAFDGSFQMAALASDFTGLPVQHKYFSDLQEKEEYDGIWTSASLLHVPQVELPAILQQLKAALKPNGVWYMSFREGKRECHEGDRYFNDQTENSLLTILEQLDNLEILYLGIPDHLRSRRGYQFVSAVVRLIS